MKIATLITILFCTVNYTQSQNATEECDVGYVYSGTDCIECGRADVIPNLRIVGGVIANAMSWPAQVLIIMNYKADYNLAPYGIRTLSVRFICGGTLINIKTVLSAAHCISTEFEYNFNGKDYVLPIEPNRYYPTWESMFNVYAGIHDILFLETQSQNPSPPGVKIPVAAVVKHPLYSSSTFLNDIALMILEYPIEQSSAVKIACIPRNSSRTYPEPELFQYTYACGWGSLEEGGGASSKLYNVRLDLYNSSYCSRVSPFLTKDWRSQICSGSYNGSRDTCQGDSGGGLYVYDSKLNKYIVSGVTSYGDGCARAYKPGLYTRISFYVSWIRENWETVRTLNYATESQIESPKSGKETLKAALIILTIPVLASIKYF